MENEEMTNDAAVAWYYEFGDTGEAGPVTFGGDPGREAIEWAERYGHTLHYLVPATTVAELRAEVAYYKENFLSCMATLNAINDAITEADEEGRGFVPVHQLTAALTKESPLRQEKPE